jgi:hypothetical protein
MEKEELELQIFKKLDKQYEKGSYPIPENIFRTSFPIEHLGILIIIFGLSFKQMQETKGESDWKIDVYKINFESIIGYYIPEDELRKITKIAIEKNLIDSSLMTKCKLIVKFNIIRLFLDIAKELTGETQPCQQ